MVSADDTFKDAADATRTPCNPPASSRPLPYLPLVVQGDGAINDPALPFPLTSAVVVPVASLKAYDATGPTL